MTARPPVDDGYWGAPGEPAMPPALRGDAVTDNQQRAAELLPDAIRAYYPDVVDVIAAALDKAYRDGYRQSVEDNA